MTFFDGLGCLGLEKCSVLLALTTFQEFTNLWCKLNDALVWLFHGIIFDLLHDDLFSSFTLD